MTKMGVNLPAMMVKHFKGESIEGMNKCVTGEAVYVNEKMCMDDWDNGYISFKQYRKYMNIEGIRFIPDDEDLLPGREYQKLYYRRIIVNTVKSILRKI